MVGGGTSPNPPPQPVSAAVPKSDSRPTIANSKRLANTFRARRIGSRISRASAGVVNGQYLLLETEAVFEAVSISCEVADEPLGVIDAGENVPVTQAGNPLTERFTGLEKLPFVAATVAVKLAVPPGGMLSVDGAMVTVKSGGRRLTVIVRCTWEAAR